MVNDVVGSPGVSAESFWLPRHLSISAWAEHAPFAFWLMSVVRPRCLVELGTHTGFSFFVFAEAAKRLDIGTQLVAIDTWRGDDHAGLYGEDIFDEVRRIADTEYAETTTLIRSYFADAVDRIEDKSVDLLHIDGRHGYEDVRQDYGLYLPKLSERAVVLFHDTYEFSPGFGVHEFWREIAKDRFSFNFQHGHGLGVLAVGNHAAPELLAFLEQASADPERIRATFASLGADAGRMNDEGVLGRQAVVQIRAAEDRATALGEALRSARLAAAQEREHILTSTSWRLTAPLRAIGQFAAARRLR